MYSDWSAELAADSPVLSIPWTDESGRLAYVDLRQRPEGLRDLVRRIPEVVAHPELGAALLALNSAPSPVFTAKCDAWPLDANDVAACADLLDLVDDGGGSDSARFGFGSYIDTVLRDLADFASFDVHNGLLRSLARGAAGMDFDDAASEFVLRLCAMEEGEQSRIGYAITVYVHAIGATEALAYAAWAHALQAISEMLAAT